MDFTKIAFAGRRGPPRLSAAVAAATCVLVALAAASLLHIGWIASREADAQARVNEERLLANALRDRQVILAREQLALARWTRSYEAIARRFDVKFLRDEFADWLWSDFAHDDVYLVGPGGVLLMASHEGTANFEPRALDADDPVAVIARRAVERFMASRVAVDGVFRQKRVPAARVVEIAELGFGRVAGAPAMLGAMAVTPDDDDAMGMPDGPPVALVSAKRLDGAFAAEINAQLAFADFRFESASARDGHSIAALDGTTLGAFVWNSERPGAAIWRVVVPTIALLALALILAAALVARVIGRTSNRLEASEARNRKLAFEDALSGLANRLSFNQALDAAVARLPGAPFAVIACDLDRFKAVNDTFGHAAGDAVIKTVADRLRAIIGEAGLVARMGGDEFVILVTAFTDRARLALITGAILTSIRLPIEIGDGVETDVGVSLGVAAAPACGPRARDVMASADAALYVAKERGRGVAVFASDLSAEQARADAA